MRIKLKILHDGDLVELDVYVANIFDGRRIPSVVGVLLRLALFLRSLVAYGRVLVLLRRQRVLELLKVKD